MALLEIHRLCMTTKIILNSLINIALFFGYKVGKIKKKSTFNYYRKV